MVPAYVRTPLRSATRGSPLALWQTHHIGQLLGIDMELVVVTTAGDRTQHAAIPIESVGGQGVFVKEVQAAVLDGRADIAVHSAKDLPSQTEDGLVLACVPQRGDPRDALVGCALESLPTGATVATGSVRRRAQLASRRPDLTFAPLRGNIETRLEKQKNYDAIVMAHAALVRMKRIDIFSHPLDPTVMVPQVAQGALAIECRKTDEATRELLALIEHEPSRRAVDAERSFLASMSGGCNIPVGAYATVLADGNVHMQGLISTLDGRIVLRCSDYGPNSFELGQRVAESLLERSGGAQVVFGS